MAHNRFHGQGVFAQRWIHDVRAQKTPGLIPIGFTVHVYALSAYKSEKSAKALAILSAAARIIAIFC
jgi:hypothetical protein